MAVMYLSEQGAKITMTGNRLVLKKEGEKIADIPIIKLNTILIYGNVQITTQAVRMLLKNGIDVAFFDYYGNIYGILTPVKSKNVVLRMNQFDKSRDNGFALKIAKGIVNAKIINMISFLKKYQKNYCNPEISNAIKKLKKWMRKVDYKTKAKNLLGIEGSASVIYFDVLKLLFRGELKFNGRNRRPPADEANALLSYTYVLFSNEINMLLNGNGLDPYIGFYHGIQYGRYSLALDMVEPFRPLADNFVLNLANLKILQSKHFETVKGGVYLKNDAKKLFFKHYEKYMNQGSLKDQQDGWSIRNAMRLQVASIIQAINDKKGFMPFTL